MAKMFKYFQIRIIKLKHNKKKLKKRIGMHLSRKKQQRPALRGIAHVYNFPNIPGEQ